MPNLADLNALDRESFARVVGPVFEHSPWIAERAWTRRPFASVPDLHEALCSIVRDAAPNEQLALIRAHPDLVTRETLTTESVREQAGAGLNGLSQDEAGKFREYNAQYRERFGFPFVICARLNKRQTILHAFAERLQNSPEREREIALREICQIAQLRLTDLIK